MEPNSKGSVLAYSLIILSVMLLIAISLSAVTLTQTKGALTGQNSSQAFQTADSGVQVVLKKIEKASPTANVNSIGCSDGKISGTLSAGTYEVQLYKYDSSAGADIAMSDCSAKIEEITKIKSVGKYAGTARAVEVAVAGGNLTCVTRTGTTEAYCQEGEIMTGGTCQGNDNCGGNDSSAYGGLFATGTSGFEGIQCKQINCTSTVANVRCCKMN